MKRISSIARLGSLYALALVLAAVLSFPAAAGAEGNREGAGKKKAGNARMSEKLEYFKVRSVTRAAEKAEASRIVERASSKRIVAAVICGPDGNAEAEKLVGYHLKKKLVAMGYAPVLVKAVMSDGTSREQAARWLMKKHSAASAVIVDIKKFRNARKFSPVGAYVDVAFLGFTSRAEIVLGAGFYAAESRNGSPCREYTAAAVKRNAVLVAFQHPEGIMSRCAGAAVADLLAQSKTAAAESASAYTLPAVPGSPNSPATCSCL